MGKREPLGRFRAWSAGACACLLAVGVGLLPAPAQAHWLGKLLGAADELSDAGKLGRYGGLPDGLAGALAAQPGRLALMRDGAQVVAVDAAGRRVLHAALGAEGAALLSDDALRAWVASGLLVAEEQLAGLQALVLRALALREEAVQVVRADGSLARLRRLPDAGGGTGALAVEAKAGVYLRLQGAADGAPLLAQAIDRSRLRVVSLLDPSDADSLHRLDAAAGSLHLRAAPWSAAELARFVRASHRGTLLVVGHVEDGSFAVRDASGVLLQRVEIAALEEAAASADAALVLLGCGAGVCARSAGFVADVNARHVAAGLRRALDADTMGDALSALARHGGDLLIHEATSQALRSQLRVQALAPGGGLGSNPVVGVWMVSAARSAELQARLLPGIPSALQNTYLAGCLLLLFQARTIWRSWRPTWRPAPAARRAPLRCLAVHGTRWLVFAGFMPWATLLIILAHLLPWAAAAALLVLAWPAALIGLVAGGCWWRGHRAEAADHPIGRALLAIPFMAVAVAAPVALLAAGAGNAAAQVGVGGLALHELGSWALQAVLALPLALALLRLARSRGWLPAHWLAWLADQPLRLVEAAAEQVWWRRSRLDGGT
jgi:hypothetical protein